MKLVSRSAAVLALATALTAGGAAIASASPRGNAGDCASARISPFDYAGGGTGGLVTGVTSTTLTLQSPNGTSTTYTLGASVTVTEGGQPATLSDVVDGDRVQIQTSAGSTTTVTAINIELAELFGTVSSVNGETILITDFQGFTRTILVSNATTYTEGGQPATLSDVVEGSKIRAAGTVDANGTTLDALTVAIGGSAAGQTETIKGTVTATTTSSVTITTTSGTSTTFTYTSDTTFKADGATVSSTEVANGQRVDILVNTSAPTTALTVRICLSHLAGKVTAVNGNDITIMTRGGFSPTIIVSNATTYTEGGSSATLSDVVTGVMVSAAGTVDANGTSLDALTVTISTGQNQGQNQGQGSSNVNGNTRRGGDSGLVRTGLSVTASSGQGFGLGFAAHGRFGHGRRGRR